MARQGDFFNPDPQNDLFDDMPTPEYRPEPGDVRKELHRLLALVRSSETLPWDRRRADYFGTVFPQMANWLPQDEAAQLCFDFSAELARLRAA
jgi:hypothetical protein